MSYVSGSIVAGGNLFAEERDSSSVLGEELDMLGKIQRLPFCSRHEEFFTPGFLSFTGDLNEIGQNILWVIIMYTTTNFKMTILCDGKTRNRLRRRCYLK